MPVTVKKSKCGICRKKLSRFNPGIVCQAHTQRDKYTFEYGEKWEKDVLIKRYKDKYGN